MAVMEGDPRQGAKLPLFGGSTGGLLSAAETEEKYVITWTGKPGQVFEMPTGGAAEMVEGKNFLTFARKEQCLALGAQLRSDYKINDYQIFRIPAGGGSLCWCIPKTASFPRRSTKAASPSAKWIATSAKTRSRLPTSSPAGNPGTKSSGPCLVGSPGQFRGSLFVRGHLVLERLPTALTPSPSVVACPFWEESGCPWRRKAPAHPGLEPYPKKPGIPEAGSGPDYLAIAAKNSLDFTGSGCMVFWPGCQLAGQTSSG